MLIPDMAGEIVGRCKKKKTYSEDSDGSMSEDQTSRSEKSESSESDGGLQEELKTQPRSKMAQRLISEVSSTCHLREIVR